MWKDGVRGGASVVSTEAGWASLLVVIFCMTTTPNNSIPIENVHCLYYTDIFPYRPLFCTPPQGKLLVEGGNHGYHVGYAHALCHMINTLSNAYGKISLVIKVLQYTRAIHTLMTRDILPYGLDNVIMLWRYKQLLFLTSVYHMLRLTQVCRPLCCFFFNHKLSLILIMQLLLGTWCNPGQIPSPWFKGDCSRSVFEMVILVLLILGCG